MDLSGLDAIVAAFAQEHRCPSIVWAYASTGRIVAHGSTGRVAGRSPGLRTPYRIASMTKSFSAAATLLLRDTGALALDDPIDHHVAAFRGVRSPTDDAPAVTVRDLLGMSSGLATDDPWADRHLDLSDSAFDLVVERGLVFARPTGHGFEYSNFGFAVLGRLVREITGAPLQTHVSERLLEPLGLTATSWSEPTGDDHAPPVRRDGTSAESPPLGDGTIAPMGGLWSTAEDLVSWASWLADAFPARDGRDDGPLRRSSRREMQQPQRYVGRRSVRGELTPVSYGHGLFVLDDKDHGPVVGHSGGLPGYGSNMRWTPGGDVVLVALANRTYAPMAELNARLHDHVAELLGVPDAPLPAPEFVLLIDRLVAVLRAWSDGHVVDAAVLDSVFADNVAPDEPFTERSVEFARLGPLRFDPVSVLGGASAALPATTADGRRVRIELSLAPARPLKVQHLIVTADAP